MKRQLIAKALGNLDGVLLEECMTYGKTCSRFVPERKNTMGKYEDKRRSGRKLWVLALAACLVFAMAATAYAANLFGIRELFYRELPQEADAYIQTHTQETIASQEQPWKAEVTESLADGTKLMLTIRFTCDEKYLLVPGDIGEEEDVGYMGLEYGKTMAEYARELDRELLFVGASLMQDSTLGVFTETRYPQSVSPGELDILLVSDRMNADPVKTVSCQMTAHRGDPEQVERLELSVPLSPVTDGETFTYVPENPEAVPGLILGNATVTKSATGWNVQILETFTDRDAAYKIMKTEIVGLEIAEGGGVMLDETHCQFQCAMAQGDIGETMTVRYYDWDKVFIAEVNFRRQ